jgi:hypothetical protein
MNPSLLLIPDRYKKDKLYSQIPDSGAGDLTFARNSNATRVNSAGLIEKVRTNIQTHSQDFSNAVWIKSAGATLTHSQTDPNGGTTASRLQMPSGTSNFLAASAISGLTNGGKYTHSIFMRSNTGSTQSVRILDGVRGAAGGTLTASVTTSWQRFEVVITTASTSAGLQIDNVAGTFANDILIAFAQTEESDFGATDYIPTTTAAVSVGITADIPRLDYTGGGCPSLLLEPQRTNSSSQSEDFNGWSIKVNVTTTANYAVSPDGYQNADRLVFTSNGFMYPATGVSQTNGVVYTLSCYAKRNGSGTQSIGFFKDGSGGVDSAWALTSNYQRFTYTYTAGNTSVVGIGATSGADVSVYGFQFEAGAYPTSYIPTLGSSVTRLADAASKTGISSLIGQTQGTIFIDFEYNQTPPDVNGRLLQLWGTSETTDSILPLIFGAGANANQFQLTVFSGTTGLIPIVGSAGTTVPFGRQKFAIAYNAGVYTVYRNGSLFASGSSLAPVSLTALDLGGSTSFARIFGNPINQALLFTTRLTNAELQSLTAL